MIVARSVSSGLLATILMCCLAGCSLTYLPEKRPDSRPTVEVGGVLSGGSVSEAEWEKRIEIASQSVVKVVVRTCSNRKIGTGSGFSIGDYFVTNRHVIESAERIELDLPDGSSLTVESWASSRGDDLALLKVKRSRAIERLQISPIDARPGDVVAAVGFPLGGDKEIRRARILELTENRKVSRTHALASSAFVQPGDSGGPLIDSAGQVVAITTAIDLQSNESLSVPSSRLIELLEQTSRLKFQASCDD